MCVCVCVGGGVNKEGNNNVFGLNIFIQTLQYIYEYIHIIQITGLERKHKYL